MDPGSFDSGAKTFTVTIPSGLTSSTTYNFTAWATGGTSVSGSSSAPESFSAPISFAPRGFVNAAPAATRSGSTFVPPIYNFRTPVDGGMLMVFNGNNATTGYPASAAADYSFTKMFNGPKPLVYYELDPIVGMAATTSSPASTGAGDPVSVGTIFYMLDRDLGALKPFNETTYNVGPSASDLTIYDAVGYYYQWNLNVPSHSPYQSTGAANGNASPGVGANGRANNQTGWAMQSDADLFCITMSSPTAWLDNVTASQALNPSTSASWWTATKYDYSPERGNPCPAGYVIPSLNQYESMVGSLPAANQNLDGLYGLMKIGITRFRANTAGGPDVNNIAAMNNGNPVSVVLWTSSCKPGNVAHTFILDEATDSPNFLNTNTTGATPGKSCGIAVRCMRKLP